MTEAELLAEIDKLCEQLGLHYVHHPDSRRVHGRGWPDLTILGPRGALFRECKSANGTLRPDQRKVGSWLTGAGLDWAVWRPVTLLTGVIEQQLRRIAKDCNATTQA